MKPQRWWEPGRDGGLLSRRWAQAYVFPLPSLKRSDLETSLRFKVQALLPSPDLPLSTRFFHHQGRLYGLVILDRVPEPQPKADALALGMPLVLPSSWPSEMLLAVASPEGWEIHGYEKRVLAVSYPPIRWQAGVADKIRGEHPGQPVYWVVPDPRFTLPAPEWATPAPRGNAGSNWGIPWAAPREPRWPWVLGGLLCAVGLVAWLGAGAALLQDKHERNQKWEAWLGSARTWAGAPTLTAQNLAALRAQAGEPLDDVLVALARVWPTGVEIRRLEMAEGKISLTARATSALVAVAKLAQEPLGTNFRVLQIRPVPEGEEFDLEGKVSP